MGTKLQGIIERKIIDFSRLRGKIIAIDAQNIIFSLFSFAFKNNRFADNIMTDSTQRAISHLYGLLYRMNFYYTKRIFPIFVFDGREYDLKRKITKNIINDFNWTKKEYQRALSRDMKEARRIACGREFFWVNTIRESKALLNRLGVPLIESPSSAESQCADLVKKGIVNFANTQDFDTILFGCPKTIQNLSKTRKRKVRGKWVSEKINMLEINLMQNLDRLEINQFQLIDLAILVGVDYFKGVKGIGQHKALNLIKKYGTIENVIRNERNKYDFKQLTPEIIKKVRKIFIFPEVNKRIPTLYWNTPDKSKIYELMCEDHTLNKERVNNNIDKLMIQYEKCQKIFKNISNNPLTFQKSIVDIISSKTNQKTTKKLT